jgi:hypothetical protein
MRYLLNFDLKIRSGQVCTAQKTIVQSSMKIAVFSEDNCTSAQEDNFTSEDNFLISPRIHQHTAPKWGVCL